MTGRLVIGLRSDAELRARAMINGWLKKEPTCPHCGTHVVGHGVEKDGTIFCCAHCAKQEGVTQLRDRA
jgi:uncharacterized Zn finger protein (UPF0148 family)